MYATVVRCTSDRRHTASSLNAPLRGGDIINIWNAKLSFNYTGYIECVGVPSQSAEGTSIELPQARRSGVWGITAEWFHSPSPENSQRIDPLEICVIFWRSIPNVLPWTEGNMRPETVICWPRTLRCESRSNQSHHCPKLARHICFVVRSSDT